MADDNRSYLEAQRVAASMKSYTGPAVLVLILYLFLLLPGLIANILYYKEARRMQRIAGHGLPGVGCLAVMLWLGLASLVLGIVSLIAGSVMTGVGICGALGLVLEAAQ